MTLLQQSLRTVGLIETLADNTIEMRRSKVYPNLILFTYDQFNADMSNKIVQESRGIILDEANNWEIVSRSFDKFFNFGEIHCAPIDYASATFFKKEDGSMISLYFYDNKWNVATTGSPDAGGNMGVTEKTFAEMFWKVFEEVGGETINLDINNTYIFELCTPYNKVVVNHKYNRLALLACRSKITGNYQPRVNGIAGKIPWVESFALKTMDDALRTFNDLQGSGFEGYVVEDSNGNRIKVKHPGYVALHHFMDHKLTSLSKLLHIVVKGEVSEVLSYFPEYEEDFANLQVKLDKFKVSLEESYNKHKNIEVQKDFAIAIKDEKFKSAMFMMRNKNMSVEDIVINLSVENLLELINV